MASIDPGATPVPATDDLLSDPLSERVEVTNPRGRWPSEDEIRTSPERDLIARFQHAADHEKRFEHDLVRERAAWALTRVRDGGIVAPLLEALEAEDWRIQTYAAWALAAIDVPQATPPIRRLLNHPNWRVRAQAASSLLELRAVLPMDVVDELARDPAWQVRMSAVEFLLRTKDPEARPMLERMRNDPHAGTRMQVEAALAPLSAG